MSEKHRQFECPTFLDFNDPNVFDADDKENDDYFGMLIFCSKLQSKMII